jgi:peptide/nickel transport system ATP-binding protein
VSTAAIAPPSFTPGSPSADSRPLLTVNGLVKHFPIRRGVLQRTAAVVRAVDGVSFAIEAGETVGLVGESGCGKSTLARLILRLVEANAGSVWFGDEDLLAVPEARLKRLRRDLQLVFQDPYASLNPRMTMCDAIAFNLLIHGAPRSEARQRAADMLRDVGLDPDLFGSRYAHELSGGQRQRVNIARALVLDPKLVVLDEPVSALDKSVQAQVLNLLQQLKAARSLTYFLISHDLNVIEYVSDRVIVLYLGKIVEVGPATALIGAPKHPYTQALFASAPSLDPSQRLARPPVTGDPPNPIDPPSGCRFRTRCPLAMPECAESEPLLREVALRHSAACHLYP